MRDIGTFVFDRADRPTSRPRSLRDFVGARKRRGSIPWCPQPPGLGRGTREQLTDTTRPPSQPSLARGGAHSRLLLVQVELDPAPRPRASGPSQNTLNSVLRIELHRLGLGAHCLCATPGRVQSGRWTSGRHATAELPRWRPCDLSDPRGPEGPCALGRAGPDLPAL